jgi:hypothetical protein
MASSNPFRVGSLGWCTLIHQNHAAGGGNGSIMVEMYVSLCLASKKPSEWEFFVPAGSDLGVKLGPIPYLENSTVELAAKAPQMSRTQERMYCSCWAGA